MFTLARRLGALALVALLIPACDGSIATAPPPATITMVATLHGSQEVPAVVTGANASATLTRAGDGNSLDFSIVATGLGTVTGVTINFGVPGVNGPVLFTLATGAFANPLTGTLTSFDLSPASALGINTFTDAMNSILVGNLYVNITTLARPAGEVRGQIGKAILAAVRLNGAQEVPLVNTIASARMSLQFDHLETQFDVTITTSGLTLADVTKVVVRLGNTGSNGNLIFTLFTGGTFTNPYTATITVLDFTAQPGDGIVSFEDGLNALLSGVTYVNIETGTNPAGEIRGEIGPARFVAALDTGQEVTPPTGLPGAPPFPTGAGTLVLNGTQTGASYTLSYSDLTSTVLGAQIRVAANPPPKINGPTVFLLAGSFASPTAGTLSVVDIDPGSGYLFFEDVVEAILGSGTYFNINTATNPAGEVRGQIVP